MSAQINILIVKYGALGDVVRTSFFAKPLRTKIYKESSGVRLFWLTAPESASLLRFNPYIDAIVTNADEIKDVYFEEIYSLDDEMDVLYRVAKFRAKNIIGASIGSDGTVKYCERSSPWFDMGLLSRYGSSQADSLKRLNNRSHSDIFREIFQVDGVDFSFYNSSHLNGNLYKEIQRLSKGKVAIGLNAFAGKRWVAKALPDFEFPKLVQKLSDLIIDGRPVHLFLIGSGADFCKNQEFVSHNMDLQNITALNTDGNILELAAAINSFKLLITTDSLCLHLAVAQCVSTVAFFAPTSAAEIENLPHIRKLKSLSDDYCNYRPNADNRTITAERILKEIVELFEGGASA